jgi:hypothetical protein
MTFLPPVVPAGNTQFAPAPVILARLAGATCTLPISTDGLQLLKGDSATQRDMASTLTGRQARQRNPVGPRQKRAIEP